MRKIDFNTHHLSFLMVLIFFFNSCVKDEYEINDTITDNIVIGGDSLIIPIGTSGNLLVSNMIDAEDIDLLGIDSINGSYSFFTNDSINVDVDQINTSSVKLDKEISSSQKISFRTLISMPTIPGFSNTINSGIPETNTKIDIEMQHISIDAEPLIIPLVDMVNEAKAAYPANSQPEYIPISKTNSSPLNGETQIETSEFLLPNDIESINTIYTSNEAKTISFTIGANYLPTMKNSQDNGLTIDTLKIQFPKNFIFENEGDAVGIDNENQYILTDYSFSKTNNEKNLTFKLKSIDCSNIDQSNKNFSINDKITYSCSSFFEGSIKTEGIINNPEINISIGSALGFDNAQITTNDISQTLKEQTTNFEISSYLGDITHIDNITFKTNPFINITFDYPNTPFDINANEMTIKFPDFLVFKENQNGLDTENNIYTFSGDLENKNIKLEVKSFKLNQDLENGSLDINGEIKVNGGIILKGTQLTTEEITAFEKKSINITTKIDDMELENANFSSTTITDSVSGSEPLNIDTKLPTEITSLDSITLRPNAKLSLDLTISDLPKMNTNKIRVEAYIELPKLIKTNTSQDIVDADNIWKISKDLKIDDLNNNGEISDVIDIKSFDFTKGNYIQGQNIAINEDVKYNVKFYIIDPKNIESSQLNDLNVDLKVKLSDMELNTAYGIVNPKIENNHSKIEINGIPDFLQDDKIVLDIKNPIIKITSKSNVGIPIDATISLKAYVDGSVKETQTIDLSLKKANLNEDKKQGFWIANRINGLEEGYTYIETDLSKLFKAIPDSISLDVSTEIDNSEQHIIDLTKDLFVDINYDVVVPLAFGKDLSINKDTIIDIDDDDIIDLIRDNSAKLTGTIINTIPIELKLTIVPIDENNTPLDEVSPIIQSIKPGITKVENGKYITNPVKTTLDLSILNEEGQYDKIKNFLVTITGLSPSGNSRAIMPNDYVNISFSAMIPGGLNISKIIDDDK